MFPRLSQGRQRLHHEPCGIVGVFYRQFLLAGALREELGEVNGLDARLVLRIGNGLGDVFAVG